MELPLRFNTSLLTMVLLATLVFTNVPANERVVCCYYNYKARLRLGNAQMSLATIIGLPCSHLVYNHADFDTHLLKLKQERFTSQELDFLKFLNKTGKTKALLGFTQVTEVAEKTTTEIQTFAKQTATFLRDNFFHGLELNTLVQGSVGENKFKELCQALKNAFSKVSGEQEKLILSAMFKAEDSSLTESVNASQSLLDFVVVKAMPEVWYKTCKIVHPTLYVQNGTYFENRTMTFWKSKGIPEEKLVLLVPTFGWSYKLLDENTHGIGQKTAGKADAGPLTYTPGFLAYYEICDRIKRGVYSHVNEGTAPTAWGRRQGQLELVAYETPASIEQKGQFIIDNQFRGLAFDTLDFDDPRGTCGKGFFPLTKAGWNKLIGWPLGKKGAARTKTSEEEKSSSAQQSNSMNGLVMFAVAVGVINNVIF